MFSASVNSSCRAKRNSRYARPSGLSRCASASSQNIPGLSAQLGTVVTLKTVTIIIQGIASELPATVQEQCLAEYKKVLENAVRNYNQMQKSAEKWQKSIEEKKQIEFKIITASAIVTPVLMVLLVFLK